MKKIIFTLVGIGFVLATVVVGIRQLDKPSESPESNQPAASEQADQQSYLAIKEWGVKVPLAVFGDRQAKGYVIGTFPGSADEAVVFIDTTVEELTSTIGSENMAIFKRCVSYTPSISRNATSLEPATDDSLPTEMKPAPVQTLNGYEYRVITPQAVCPEGSEPYPSKVLGERIVGTINNDGSVQPAEIAKAFVSL